MSDLPLPEKMSAADREIVRQAQQRLPAIRAALETDLPFDELELMHGPYDEPPRYSQYKKNDRVYWNDPDSDVGSGPGVVIDADHPEVIQVLKFDGSEVEACEEELEYLETVYGMEQQDARRMLKSCFELIIGDWCPDHYDKECFMQRLDKAVRAFDL